MSNDFVNHDFFMNQAYKQALIAYEKSEVPIGAVLVYNSQIIVREHNKTLTLSDPTAHAEMLAIKQAADVMKNHRLVGAKLYVTLEPCIMCLGAIVQARIAEVIYACDDLRVGPFSREGYHKNENLNHNLKVTTGIMADECSQLLKRFFLERRKK